MLHGQRRRVLWVTPKHKRNFPGRPQKVNEPRLCSRLTNNRFFSTIHTLLISQHKTKTTDFQHMLKPLPHKYSSSCPISSRKTIENCDKFVSKHWHAHLKIEIVDILYSPGSKYIQSKHDTTFPRNLAKYLSLPYFLDFS